MMFRFGKGSEDTPLCFQWYYDGKPQGVVFEIHLKHGDALIMSDKAVGWDWKAAPKKQWTLRHATGEKTTPARSNSDVYKVESSGGGNVEEVD